MTLDSSSQADLDATLAVLNRLIAEIQDSSFDPTGSEARVKELVAAVRARPHLKTLPTALLKAYSEIVAVLSGIRVTRETIQTQALDQLKDTQDRLNAVSTATESAAMEIMNGLDRTLGLLDRLDAAGGGDRDALATLRDEVNQLFGHLQFQDIITQQLRGVMGLVIDVEARISRVADLFDQSLAQPGTGEHPVATANGKAIDPHAYNADAVWSQCPERQALADAAFVAVAQDRRTA